MAVRNEKTMEKKRIPVRPHHGMCLAYFIGKGYSEGFSAHMEKMLHILEQDVPIRLVVSLDEICSACPNHQFLTDEENPGEKKEICEAQEKVFRYDHGVLEACGLTEGEELNFLEFAQKVQKKVIDTVSGMKSAVRKADDGKIKIFYVDFSKRYLKFHIDFIK